MSTQTIGADIIGMGKTNTAWQHHHLQASLTSWAWKHFGEQTFHLVTQTPPSIRFLTKKPSNLEDPSPCQLGASYQCHTGETLRIQLVWDPGVDTPFKESQMHSDPSSLHTELAQNQLGHCLLAAHSAANKNTSVNHNNLLFPKTKKTNDSRPYRSNENSSNFWAHNSPYDGLQCPNPWRPRPAMTPNQMWSPQPTTDKPSPFYIQWFRSPMHWLYGWIFAALTVGYTLGFPIISG